MKIKKMRLFLCIMFLMFVMSLGDDVNAQEVIDVSEEASDVYQVDVFENRNTLAKKMIEKSDNGSAEVKIGNYSTLDYQYNFSCSEESFKVGYKGKNDGWVKTFSLTYNYETDSVDITFQQLKNSNFYAATATFIASEFTNVESIVFKDATDSNYGSMCVTYAEHFAKEVFPSINTKMINMFESSLYKIGFTSYEHNHGGGSATCVKLAKCQICDKEYGELNDHETELVNTKQETYYEEGYTGDLICTVCGKIVESGTVIPMKERIEATGKFALVKKFLQEKGQTDDNGDKYFHDIVMVSDKIGAISTITYIEDEAKFQFAYGNINNNSIESTIAMYIEENGSQTVTVDYSHNIFSINASATFDVAHYTSGGKEYFEKTSSNILDNSEIQDLCNAQLKAAFDGWDLVLAKNFGFDVNMADMGFTSYEKAGTHTWNSGVITRKATCEKNGIKIYTCTICGDSVTGDIPKSNSHTWNSGKITKKATINSKGEKTYTCTICKTTKTEKIPKLKVTKKEQKIKVATSKNISMKKVKNKAQSFKLSAKSTSGSKVKYKLVKGNKNIKFVASSGKITVKKGTKKGTHKIKVKMTVSENSKYKSYSTTKTITIKVK